MLNARLDEAQVGINIAGRNTNNLRYANDTTVMAESEELKSFLMKGKEESEKAGLKLNIQKLKIMVFSLITSWQIDGEIMEIVTDFLFLISFLGLIFSCQSTKITTSFWTTIDRMTLEPTKKDTLHPRTKEKPQQHGRRGTITIKSNPMPARWWLTNWRTIIPKKFSHLWRF